MMKKTILLITVLAITSLVSAQNIQLHFDPRHGLHSDEPAYPRNYVTTTFEMFRADKWGSTYMFVDLDFNLSKGNIGMAYTEIMRDQKIGKSPIMAHVEFNGGVGKGFSIPSAYLGGASYATNIAGINLSTYVAYKYHAFDKASHDIQWTAIWGVNLLKDKVTISGFVDVWTENKNREKVPGKSGKKIVLLSEPQFWYNITSNLSFGSEFEISNNFNTNKAYVNPTIATKWNF